ncbi:hypothetical protein B0I10_1059 [Flavobacterium lacus]|uniref:Uncharacterized protein n=2 Tax=Flavobacterium lacus TaxID=1353778 RepID=A0A328WQ72_9FLAO|nr:hypothetical protein B0I10_1059 [Flavobacterium lacus]
MEKFTRRMEINLLQPREDFVIETFDEFEKRYLGFGKEIYSKIKENLPEIFNNLVFYKRVNFQLEDSYAEFKSDQFPFGIQLDPLCEVIVLWSDCKHIEIGYWAKNEYEDAINYIKSELLK